MSPPVSAMITSAVAWLTPGMVSSRSMGVPKGGHRLLDPPGELVDHGGELVVLAQIQTDQERVVLAKPPGQGLGQFGDLAAEPSLGQVRQDLRVAFACGEGLEHGAAGDAHDVGGDRGELDAGVFEQFLQALDHPAAFPGDGGAGPGQVPQLAYRLGRDERRADQAVGAELVQPGRVRDVGLAAGQVLDVPRVDQDHVQVLGQHVVVGLPVVRRRLDHHQRHLRGEQVLPQGEHRVRRRPPRWSSRS